LPGTSPRAKRRAADPNRRARLKQLLKLETLGKTPGPIIDPDCSANNRVKMTGHRRLCSDRRANQPPHRATIREPHSAGLPKGQPRAQAEGLLKNHVKIGGGPVPWPA
jgi:hypothetical protein